MVRGGRGGEVRLKLFLSMQLIAVQAPHNIVRRPASWASLLALPDPGVGGARRINDAIKWLGANKLIRLEPKQGGPAEVFLLSQLGDGQPYSRPGGRYVNLPVAFWENDWLVTLSAAATAMWLITCEMQGGKKSEADAPWISPALAQERYDLSDDTRSKGTRELAAHGLLTIGRTKQGEEWAWDRLRNTYWLNKDRLQDQPGDLG